MPTERRQILILVDTSTTWGAEAIRGIDEFSQLHGRWLLQVEARGELELSVPRNWKGHGVIARVTEISLARQLKRCGIPAVNVSWSVVPGYRFPQVTPDEVAVGRLAALHLLERGFRNFAYCGLPKQPNYTDRCGPAYVEELQRHGHTANVFVPRARARFAWETVTIPNLQSWLRSLPTPVGILAWGPERGRNVTDACQAEGIHVPDEVAAITTADDELLCGISHPALSAVDERPRVVGYQAAALLHRLMSGERTPHGPVLVAPQRIMTRHSTDVIANVDQEVAQALRFIRERFADPISVRDILGVVHISRRVLEQRFQLALGRSPAAEIRRVRLACATEHLVKTNWKISQVATASGFAHVWGMIRIFQRELRMTPSEYRIQALNQGNGSA